MKIPVVNSQNESIFLELDEIIYFTTNERNIEIFNHNQVYHALSTLKEWENLLKPHGFEQLDQSNVVNMSKITRYDKNTNIVFFDSPNNPSKSVYVSKRNIHKIENS